MCWIKEFIDMYGSNILPFASNILKASMASNSNQDIESQIRKYCYLLVISLLPAIIIYIYIKNHNKYINKN